MQQIFDDQGNITNSLDYKIEKAIERYKAFEPKEGYYLAFSGGKDSIVIKALADMAGVKYDAHYAITSIDPPELTKFIKKHHPDVIRHAPDTNMYELIVQKRMPPTRIVRYCCEELKEEGGQGRFVVTGVRWAESVKRRSRKEVEFDAYGSQSKKAIKDRERFNLMNDNDEKRQMIENCTIKGKHVLNPIIDWTDQEVWEFIHKYQIPYCKLYDEGFKRLGCIGCPLSGSNRMIEDFKRYPFVFKKLLKAFNGMIEKRVEDGLETQWLDGDEVMRWWLDLSDGEYRFIKSQMGGRLYDSQKH